ncbi:MAG: type II secretion system F family protein [Bdellovibrionota bacterium]
MAEYTYEGVDRGGKRVGGKMQAAGEAELRMLLRGQGIRPVRIGKVGAMNRDIGAMLSGAGGSVPIIALIGFTRQLQVLITAGIPLVQALDILSEQSDNSTMRTTMLAIKEKVSGGRFLWEAMSNYPRIFPKLYLALIRAGESSGSIDQMLKRLTRYLEDADRLQRMLKSAMMYPIIVVSIGIAVIAVMLAFVIPKFEELLKGAGQKLPWITQVVIDASHFMAGNFFYIVGGVGVTVYVSLRYLKSNEGKAVFDRIFFRAPLFGEIMRKAGVARFSRTMFTLLSSGVNLLDAIDICKATIENAVLEEAVAKIRAEVETGKTLGMVIGRLTVFPKMAVQMITVGESTGSLDKMLDRVADYYEEEVETLIGGLTKLIEPLVLVFLGGAVGGMMIAMYMPIFEMAGSAN